MKLCRTRSIWHSLSALSQAAALSLLVASGCSYEPQQASGRTDLSGTVSYQGQPLAGGEITIISKNDSGLMAVGMINDDGTFLVRNAPQGEVAIAVSTESMRYGGDRSRYVELPKKFLDYKQSGLTAEVATGENHPIDLRLE